jgi:RNA polymerase sigma-70 factor, ECF subfamily
VAKEKKNTADKEQFLYEAVAHLDHLYRVAFHLASETDEAGDLVQETYVRAISSYEQFNLGSNMKAWLTKILYNFFFDRYHEKKRWISVEDGFVNGTEALDYLETAPPSNPDPETYALLKELNTKVSEALRRLPEDFRTPIILVDMEDFSYTEAAEVLSCPVGTIRSRISRGRKLLQEYLRAYLGKRTK